MSERSLIDELLYQVDGESVVAADRAAEQLERVLARVRSATPEQRTHLLDEIATLHRQAELDHARAVAREIEAAERVREWNQRVAESKGELAEQARERLEQARATAEGVAEEAAEYFATQKRLEEVRALIESAG